MPLLEHDLRGIGDDAEAKLKELMMVEAQASFDLKRGPMIRARLVRMEDKEHVLLLTQHHIVSDGWSMGILARELGTLYGAVSRGEENPLEPLGIQYLDYAAWQREWLSGERLQKQSEYWRERLADAPALLELPTDRPRPEQQSFAGGYVPVVIERELTESLKELSRRQGTTLFMTLLSAWAAVLSRLSGQQEVVIGTPVANRRRAETEGLIGFFVNTLALRIDLRKDPSVAEMLKRVKGMVLGAQEHQDVPFEQVVEIVQPPRHLSHTPVFQVMFTWQNQEWSVPHLPGARVERLRMPYEAAKFDLQLDLAEEGERIVGAVNYAAALFDQETIERQRGYLLRMLEAMVADSQQEVGGIEILGTEERKLLLETWNATEAEYPEDRCIHELFEEQVRRTPEAIALVHEEQRLSYEELNRQANQLAHYLIGLGVKPDERVALCVERGVGMVVGLLGILKAGGAYVPLDPAYPGQRLREILEDAGPKILLSDAAGREAIGADALKNVMVMDVSEPVWAEQPSSDPEELGLTSRHLAYVIYTSGSTGKPKGVSIEHRNTGNLLCWARKNFAAGETQDTLFCTSLQFDLSIYECFVPLMGGGTVHVVRDALSLIDRPQPVSLVNTVPSAMASVLEHEALPSSTCTVNLAGEPLKAGLIGRLLEQRQVRRVCNLYGPTETTTYSTWMSMERGGEIVETIGRPIANTKIYLLDGKQRPVPLGAVGEIYIGGAGVARGYLNRAELTGERFLRDPFTTAENGRMYRTGDLARYMSDGNIEFLGRNDHQVKIRGFRIELGEIEARLVEHEWVREAVVVAREDGGGEKRLVAYVVPVKEKETEAGELAGILRTHLAGILPEYMVPAAFVQLEALPLTPNGKLDRKALPEPEGEAYGQRTYEPPQGEMEEQLARIWQELLGVERVGRQDHFFEMGGHSLLAMRLIARVQQVMGVELGVTTLFARPQLAQLAEAVREAGGEEKLEGLIPIVPIAREGRMPLSFAQQRLWFLAQMEGVSATYHIPAALRLSGELDAAVLKRSLDGIWARHEGLRGVFVAEEGEPRVELLPVEMGLPLIKHDLRGAVDAEEQLQRLMEEEAHAGFDLGRGPLVRACLIRTAEQEHVLLLTQHHIVSDGWSMGILARELGTLYGAFSRGEENPLEPLGIQYLDYAAWQREWLSGERLQKQSEYWREALAGAPALLELPTDRPRPEQQSFAGGGVPIRMDRELTRKLRELSHGNGTTLYMTLLGAWAAVLSRLSGQQEVVIGTPVANRRRAETEGLIGFFVNTLALRIDLREELSVAEMLKRVKKTAVGAQEHQDVPFEQVVEILQPPRHLNHTPVFQVMFTWQNQEWSVPELPGVRVEREERGHPAIKFDVELDLREEKEEIAGTLRYAAALFDEATIERQRGYLLQMLEAMVGDSQQEVGGIEILGTEERKLLLEEWNATEAEYPKHLCVHQLFEEQVRRTPEAIALVYEEQSLSYEELNRQANQLAHYLIGLGVKPDERVAICVERGLGMVVGLLGILKAGGAYVPLDPAYPSQRLQEILEDAGPKLVLSDAAGRQALGEESLEEIRNLSLDLMGLRTAEEKAGERGPEWAEQAETNPGTKKLGLSSRNLAYVIYTSGSTGRPKGVMVEHGSVVNFLCSMAEMPGITGEDRLLAVTSISFDIAGLELYLPLSKGARIVLASLNNVVDPYALKGSLATHGITLMQATPATWRGLLDANWKKSLELVVLCGGEAMPADLASRLSDQGGPIWNMYGPTETTIWSSCAKVLCPEDNFSRPSIGRPIANTEIYLLDRKQRPVPLGAVGEIYIGGAGVARGYLNRPEMTAERFVRDPFTTDGDGRMYRTGDLARYLPDGNIEFLGRNDHQVKIRGYRIELGEIEARLAEHEWVREAVVVALEDEQGEKRLVAYVVPGKEEELAQENEIDGARLAGVLREHLMSRVPQYMMPAAFVQLEEFPLTPNGKLDRKALPVPAGEAYGQHTMRSHRER